MEFAIADRFDKVIFKGNSDNAYQVRNVMLRYLSHSPHEEDYDTPHFLHVPSGLMLIWCSAEIPSLLKSNPSIINDSSRQTPISYGGAMTLASLCLKYQLCSVRSRKLLRREYGAQGRKYTFSANEIQDVLNIINT